MITPMAISPGATGPSSALTSRASRSSGVRVGDARCETVMLRSLIRRVHLDLTSMATVRAARSHVACSCRDMDKTSNGQSVQCRRRQVHR